MFFTPQQDVERGAKFLDEKFPGWHERIDLDSLDINSTRTCALAQASGQSFVCACIDNGLSKFRTKRFGFNNSKYKRFPVLTDAWKALILARRTATAA